MPKILTVIFGAGASFDCQNHYQFPNKFPRIPLTNGLFTIPPSDVPHFNHQREILKKYKGADVIGHLFERQKTGGTQNLELFLKELLKKGSDDTKKNLLQIPFYLRELIGDFGELVRSEFRQSDYVSLIHFLNLSDYEEIVLITLNYDLLLDWALESVIHANFRSFDSYVNIARKNKWHYLKFHGSVNWVYEIDRGYQPGNKDALDWLCDGIPKTNLLNESTKAICNCYGIQEGTNLLYPIMVLPNAEQKMHICPNEHIDVVRPLLNKCQDFMIIGNSMQDLDIAELLKAEAKIASRVLIVDRMESQQQAHMHFRISNILPRARIEAELDLGFSNFCTTLSSKQNLFKDISSMENFSRPLNQLLPFTD